MISYICTSIVSQTMSENITPCVSSVALRPPRESTGIVFYAMEEVWAQVDGSAGKYEVSSDGAIRNADTKTLIKQTWTGRYLYASMWWGKKRVRKSVHRLVAMAFIPNQNGLPQVNHKDENPSNNRVDNLEWCTASYNATYGGRNKRMLEARMKNNGPKKEKAVCGVRGTEKVYFDSIASAARETGIDFSNIAKCCRGNCYNKTAGGYRWEYANLE